MLERGTVGIFYHALTLTTSGGKMRHISLPATTYDAVHIYQGVYTLVQRWFSSWDMGGGWRLARDALTEVPLRAAP